MFGKKSLKMMAETVTKVAKSETTKKLGKGVLIAGAAVVAGSVLKNSLGNEVIKTGVNAGTSEMMSAGNIAGTIGKAAKILSLF